ncbi:hypothetical protein DCAR_0521375 [Daucus carota subsp. sativus]|uniref:Uncharacterized protein n=1 Tax=Daucus carota subsp. sativus TaxID=79200 RepID=A0A164Z6W7_DAUCS|nr:hypothetical protein DCAR_0521375 [Daucus carota subsp. sativus]
MDYYFIYGNNTNYNETQQLEKKKGKKKGKKQACGSKEVKLSTDPQSVAARERRHRIREKFKILQSLVPGGSKLDTVSMLEEAILYVKYLKSQVWWLMHHPHQSQYDQNINIDNTYNIDQLVTNEHVQASAMVNDVNGLHLQNVNDYENQMRQQDEGAQQVMKVDDACLEYSW